MHGVLGSWSWSTVPTRQLAHTRSLVAVGCRTTLWPPMHCVSRTHLKVQQRESRRPAQWQQHGAAALQQTGAQRSTAVTACVRLRMFVVSAHVRSEEVVAGTASNAYAGHTVYGTHAVLPLRAAYPPEHSTHGVDADVSWSYLPRAQAKHAGWFLCGCSRPAAHAAQTRPLVFVASALIYSPICAGSGTFESVRRASWARGGEKGVRRQIKLAMLVMTMPLACTKSYRAGAGSHALAVPGAAGFSALIGSRRITSPPLAAFEISSAGVSLFACLARPVGEAVWHCQEQLVNSYFPVLTVTKTGKSGTRTSTHVFGLVSWS